MLALLLLIGFTALYWTTRVAVHTYDAFTYIVDVESKSISGLYHPHHLLYGPAGRIAADVAGGLGYDGYVDQPIQLLNAAAGALGVVFLWRFAVTFSGHVWTTLGAAALMGVSFGYWVYAAEVEVYTLAAMFIALALWLLALIEKHYGRWLIVALGLATAGAVMFHQTNILFALPVIVYIGLERRGLRDVLLYVVVVGLGVGIPYGMVAIQSDLTTWDRFYDWASGYAQTGRWGGNLTLESWPALRSGLGDVVSLDDRVALVFYLLIVAGGVLGAWKLRRTPWAVFALLWLALYGGFFWWWEPWNIEFWIVLLPLWVLVLVSMLRTVNDGRFAAGFGVVTAVLAAVLFWVNQDAVQERGDPTNDYYYEVTQVLVPHLTPDDLVVTRGNILDLYVPYYARHPQNNLVALAGLNYSQSEYPAFAADLFARVDAAYRRGQYVYIDQIILDEPRSADRNPFGLEQADIERFMSAFPVEPAVNLRGQTVFYRVGEVVDSHVWQFDRSLQGWTAFAVNNPRFEDGGWCFDGGGDVWLESPPLSGDGVKVVEVDMWIADTAEYGQLFWRGAGDEDLSEVRSLRFPLQTERHIYRLEPDWSSQLVFLRLDPIPENLTVQTCLYRIELIP
jgi:hypothetical protein